MELTFPAAPAAAGEARRALASFALVGVEHEPRFLLLVSELITNSVRHSGVRADEHIRLRARCDGRRAFVEVCDPGRSGRVPGRRAPSLDVLEAGGLGLMLVQEMAERWGVERTASETCVWFEIACG